MKMKYSGRSSLSRPSALSLAMIVLLSIACTGGSSNTSPPEARRAQAIPVSSAVANPVTDPSSVPTEGMTATKLSIQITEVPSKGAGSDAMETIAGTVSGVKPRESKVVVFAFTNTWYVQPYIGVSDTEIKEDGTWRTDTHLGTRYAALLVKTSYTPPATTGKLPAVRGEVLAVAIADAKR